MMTAEELAAIKMRTAEALICRNKRPCPRFQCACVKADVNALIAEVGRLQTTTLTIRFNHGFQPYAKLVTVECSSEGWIADIDLDANETHDPSVRSVTFRMMNA